MGDATTIIFILILGYEHFNWSIYISSIVQILRYNDIIHRKLNIFLQTIAFTIFTFLIFGVHHSNFIKLIPTSIFFNNIIFLPILDECSDLKTMISCLISVEKPYLLSSALNKSRLTIISVWLSAFFIALDWKEPWQEWPIPNAYAVLYSQLIGILVEITQIHNIFP